MDAGHKMKFWKPGTDAPGSHIEEERKDVADTAVSAVVYNPNASLSIERQRQSLPVFCYRNHILYLVENYRTIVIVGKTGCGKSTQICVVIFYDNPVTTHTVVGKGIARLTHLAVFAVECYGSRVNS